MSGENKARVGVQLQGSTAVVLLENERQFNALTKDMCLQLLGAFAVLSADPAVSAIVIRGAGGNFCAGIAIDQMDQVLFDKDADGQLLNHFDLVDRAITGCPKTTIAVVEGNCFGGAWQLASACEIQLAADDVKLAITPAKIGLVFPRPGIERLVRTVGESRAKYLLYSGARIPAAEALDWGMFTRMHPAAQLDGEVESLLQALQGNSPYSIARTREAITAHGQEPVAADYESWWARLWEENGENPELAEGRRAFLERRAPRYGDA